MRGLQSAARKPFPVPRGMPQRDRVPSRIKTNFMRAGMRPGATRAKADGPCVTCRAHFFRKFFECPRWRVLFFGVMNLPSPRFVFAMLGKERRRMSNGLNKKIHAHGKIRRPHQSRLALLD